MKIGICQVDGKWPNLALAKIAAWHRSRGDEVEWFSALDSYDGVYASKVFTDTPDDHYLPPDAVRGGSGYSMTDSLMDFVEAVTPDWSLWPTWPHDMGYSTRGCIRKCPFCIVPAKEGNLRVVAEFGDLTTGRETMILPRQQRDGRTRSSISASSVPTRRRREWRIGLPAGTRRPAALR